MKEIKLTQGLVTIVDDADFERFGKFKWCAKKAKNIFYACRSVGCRSNRITQFLHREILNAPKGIDVDHKNGDDLDNRRENIRLCTNQENSRNQHHVRPGKGSRFKGVYWNKRNKKWYVHIYLGNFIDESEAARAYDAAAKKLFVEFAATNFK